MPDDISDTVPRRWVIAAFAATHLVWGSTGLAILCAVEALLPLRDSGRALRGSGFGAGTECSVGTGNA